MRYILMCNLGRAKNHQRPPPPKTAAILILIPDGIYACEDYCVALEDEVQGRAHEEKAHDDVVVGPAQLVGVQEGFGQAPVQCHSSHKPRDAHVTARMQATNYILPSVSIEKTCMRARSAYGQDLKAKIGTMLHGMPCQHGATQNQDGVDAHELSKPCLQYSQAPVLKVGK
jgi:hypothetical protein